MVYLVKQELINQIAMSIKLFKEPKLEKPDLIVGWPGIGNVGLMAVDTLRSQLEAEEFGEIEGYDFFYPKRVVIKADILIDLEFPTSKFYYKRLSTQDLIIFIGEEQPADGKGAYAEGSKAYQMANLVLDVAERFGCRRVYTSGAAVSLTHHSVKPRVWAVPNRRELLSEVREYDNTVLMSQIESRGGQGSISGLNGLLLGVARKRGYEGICLMGEVPDYLSGAPFPYPRASRSVLEVMTRILGISIDLTGLDVIDARVTELIDSIYEKFPPEIRDRLEQRKLVARTEPGAITEDDQKWIREHIDEFFKKGPEQDERPH
ncbi:hypothetical protein DRN85_09240 [Methanosarcinales archaeon]|mgnify:CR=1 FL=1|nr:MAG: hypothetical protein DRN85_09240 [Methanosarcinales archaeon]